MTRKIKRGGKVWINVFPDKSVTKKPAETRMGSGKGSPEGWVAVIKPGRVMFELAGVPEPLAKDALRLAAMKLPIRTKIVSREATSLKARELRDLPVEALEQKLAEPRHELFNLRFQSATGALENPARIRLAKREIARVLTVLNGKHV